jgi:hypothetical protein
MAVTGEELIQDALKPVYKAMDKNGLTLDYLVKKLKRELGATTTDTFKATKKEFNEDGVVVAQTEEVIYSKPLVDWKTRQAARKDALAYLGVIVTERKELSGPGGGAIPFSDLERAAKLKRLIDVAVERKEAEQTQGGQD